MDILATTPSNMLFVNTVLEELVLGAESEEVFGTLCGNTHLKELRQDIEVFFNSVMIPRTTQKVETLRARHCAGQQLLKEQVMGRSALIEIGLQLRKQEEVLHRIKSAMNVSQDVLVKESAYNHLIA